MSKKKKRDARAKLLFCHSKPIGFFFRSRRRRRRRCFGSLLLSPQIRLLWPIYKTFAQPQHPLLRSWCSKYMLLTKREVISELDEGAKREILPYKQGWPILLARVASQNAGFAMSCPFSASHMIKLINCITFYSLGEWLFRMTVFVILMGRNTPHHYIWYV